MNGDDRDDELKQLFQELKRQDAQRGPSFAGMTRAPRPAFVMAWGRLATMTAALVIVSVTLVMFHARRTHTTEDNLQQWAALSNWQASTDGLLSVSNTPWAGTFTASSDSWIPTTNPMSGTTESTEKESK